MIEPYIPRLKLSLSRMDALGAQFAAAEPFPHVVIDHFLQSDTWERFDDAGVQERKLRSKWTGEHDLPPHTRDVCRFFNSAPFLRALTSLTGIEGLVPDPYYAGGGLGCVLPGGLLDVHVDGSWHHGMGLHRRLNILLYLNEEWRDEWGGELGLYGDPDEAPVVKIKPTGNTLVVFETHDKTFHGHPDPLKSPRPRRSLLLYYYTSEPRPADQVAYPGPHSALWRGRGWKDKWADQLD
jgi:hypothetical protein